MYVIFCEGSGFITSAACATTPNRARTPYVDDCDSWRVKRWHTRAGAQRWLARQDAAWASLCEVVPVAGVLLPFFAALRDRPKGSTEILVFQGKSCAFIGAY